MRFAIYAILCGIFLIASICEVNAENGGNPFFPGKLRKTSGPTEDVGKDNENRDSKFFSLFTIIRFNQFGCNSSSETGICMTNYECSSSGGTFLGTCAAGFGVCCQYVLNTCGAIVNRNCTIIQNPNYPASEDSGTSCSYTINKCADNVCFLRLDMDKFALDDQNTTTSDRLKRGHCTNDVMTTTCSQNTNFPGDSFCGINDGQHTYLSVRAKSSCQLLFNMGTVSPVNDRAWRIKISQIECDNIMAPPAGCLQYFWGTTGTFCSFGYKDELIHAHPASQEYSICIRMETGMCSITYAVAPDKNHPFRISGPNDQARADQCPTDFISIPNALGASTLSALTYVSQLCGERFGASIISYHEAVTTRTKPFNVGVAFDEKDSATDQPGFCLTYQQNPC